MIILYWTTLRPYPVGCCDITKPMAATQEEIVKPSVEEGVVVLTVSFAPEYLLPKDASQRLSEEMIQKYEAAAKPLVEQGAKETPTKKEWPSCIVDIEAKKAGSSLVKALFELYKSVEPRGAKLVCVNYPKAYFNTLTSTGLPRLKNFELAYDKEEAFRRFFRGNW